MTVIWHKIWFDLWQRKARTGLVVLSIAGCLAATLLLLPALLRLWPPKMQAAADAGLDSVSENG